MWSILLPLALVLPHVAWVRSQQSINILFVYDEKNTIAKQAFEVALTFLQKSDKYGVTVNDVQEVVVTNSSDARGLLDKICFHYNNSIKEQKLPDIVLDATMTGITSETVKSFTNALALPTVSTSYGQEGDLRQWRDIDAEKQKYLLQIMPPGDLMPQVIRSIVQTQNISNAAILFDDTFVMDHKYKSLLVNMPTRHVITMIDKDPKKQLSRLRDVDIVNFFVVGTQASIKNVLEAAAYRNFFDRKFAWYAITKDELQLECKDCKNATVGVLKPAINADYRNHLERLKSEFKLDMKPSIDAAFYFDVTVRALIAVKTIKERGEWPTDMKYVTCDEYDDNNAPTRTNLDLQKALKEVNDPAPSYGSFVIDRNGHSFMEFSMDLWKTRFVNGQNSKEKELAKWQAAVEGPITIKDFEQMRNFSAVTVYRVITVHQPPFVYVVKEGDKKPEYKGYCIDLLDDIKELLGFDYELDHVDHFGNMDENGNWNGMIEKLVKKDADIALGSLSVMAERENVVDFTVPYYDLVGITIMMKKPKAQTSLFKFLTVLETDVWLCILAAYFFTSLLMWVFDRWSPYSYQNNREKYKDDEEKREFNLKECLWFCMTSLTPQGGGEAPKNLSGRLVAATWWLFGFIIIASYTANLAAFLTVSRLDTPIESLDDLAKQYKIQYAPINGSSAATYFQRMSDIEHRFYEIWKDMSLNDSLSDVERAKLAVWDYPVSDKYTKIWQAMKEANLPENFEAALKRVRESRTSSEGFAFLGDATDIRYQVLTNCDLQMVGEEFSRKPYAIAVQQGSPLKDQFNNAILQLLNKRKLEKLKENWWNQNPYKKKCEKEDDQSDGISIQNIGGVFIVIFVGIGLACITLAFEYWWYKYKKNPRVLDTTVVHVREQMAGNKDTLQFNPRYNYQSDFRPQGLNMAGVTNPW